MGYVVAPVPTIGFNVETLTHNNVKFTIWDVGGGSKIYLLWRHYLKDMNAMIFVIDSSD